LNATWYKKKKRGYRKTERNMTFAEGDIKGSMEHNSFLKMMERINEAIDWSKFEPIGKMISLYS